MCQQVLGAKWLQNMFTFTWHIDTFYICFSHILHGIYMWFYIYLKVFFSFFRYDEWRRTSPATGTRFPPWRSAIRATAE